MRLIGMLQPNAISNYYQIRSKRLKKQTNLYFYDKLILRHQDEVNKKEHIVLMNIGTDLFETQVNFDKHIPNSVSTTVGKFLNGSVKVLAIEQTMDTEDLGKYILLVTNKNHPDIIKRINNDIKYRKAQFVPKNERWTAD